LGLRPGLDGEPTGARVLGSVFGRFVRSSRPRPLGRYGLGWGLRLPPLTKGEGVSPPIGWV